MPTRCWRARNSIAPSSSTRKGAVAQKDLEVAEDADAKAKITVENAAERIRVLGADVNHPSAIVDIQAPVSGVIIEQNVTASAGVKTLDNSPNLFTICRSLEGLGGLRRV